VMCFQCHEIGYYTSKCPWKKNGKGVKHIAIGTIESVEDINTQFDTNFSMAPYLSSNIVSSVRWYMGSGAPRHMTYESSLFSNIQ
jgi:hypothetical protein